MRVIRSIALAASPLGLMFHANSYAIRAPGSDGRFDGHTYAVNSTTKTYDEDLVFADGNWIQYPWGVL